MISNRRVQVLEVQAFVQHTGIADTGPWGDFTRSTVAVNPSPTAEVLEVDARWHGMHVEVQPALCLVQAPPPGEDDVGAGKQLSSVMAQCRRGASKSRQLIHAVIHNARRGEVDRERHCARREVPQDNLIDLLDLDELREQTTQ